MGRFIVRKILQVLYYIQNKSKNPEKNTNLYFLKMLYFADRHHLRHHGITISNDKYYAMKLGPVASCTFDCLRDKFPKRANTAELGLLKEIKIIDENSAQIKEQEDDELSISEKMSLDFALETFGSFTPFELSRITHDYPEWIKHKEEIDQGLKSRGRVSFNIPLEDFFEDPDDVPVLLKRKKNIIQDPYHEDKEFLEAMKESVHETAC